MPKILDDKRRYLYAVYTGEAYGLMALLVRFSWIRKLRARYWSNKIDAMSEGEILARYYVLTGGTL